ncbi:MAG: alpha/beta fold hydrolase [Chloroflexota bacterium]
MNDAVGQSLGNEADEDVVAPLSEEMPGAFFEDECPFESMDNESVICGYLLVAEDRTKVDGLTVEIAVAIIPSHRDAPRPDPVLYLEGGPGGSALLGIDDWLESPLREEREIILFDQRGTGFSWPNLDCPETDAVEAGEAPEGVLKIEAVETCRNRLRQLGVDLTAYNSAASAADVEDLRVALGIETWNLFGISYGTRLALTVMRDYPTGVRSVVLDSVYPLNVDAYTVSPQTQADAILALLRACQADVDCRHWYPELEQDLYTAIDILNDEPLELEDGFVTGEDLVSALVSSLYDSETIPVLPLAISEAAFDNHDIWLELSEEEARRTTSHRSRQHQSPRQDDVEDLEDSQGMFYSVECREEAPFGSPSAAQSLMEGYPDQLAEPLLADLDEFYAACAIWGAGEAAKVENMPVESDIPTLLLAGELDPVTPPSWARLASETLTNHLYLKIPRGGHSVSSDGDCVMQIIVDFYNALDAEPDSDCIQEIRAFEGP